MRPALSVIFFTVSSGAGLGLLVWLVFLNVPRFGGGVSVDSSLWMLALGMGLTTSGLISSTLHLANPKNAWRAFSQVRTSWLSREGVLAVAMYPLAALYALMLYFEAPSWLCTVTGLALALVALGVLYCTGMIYACLKTIPRWNSRLVPASYLLLGLYSGGLAGLSVLAICGGDARRHAAIVLSLLVAASLVKLIYYFRFRTPAVVHTINDALPLGQKTIRLLDVGHTHGTFLTDEFYFKLARGHALALRVVAMVLGFAVPLLVLVAGVSGAIPLVAIALACVLGLLAERWLFFAEAQHVVRLYHGAARV
jgi:sulfite dehydrogenase (quinone) subunit SoeC